MTLLIIPTRTLTGMAIAAMLYLLLFSSPSLAQARPPSLDDVTETELLTIGGKIEVHRLSSTQEEGSSELHFQITLNGKVVHRAQYDILPGVQGYPQKGPARFVLMKLTTGGSGCPARYRVLEVKEDGRTVVSSEFGNCSNQARADIIQGALHIHMPKAGGAAAESWIYQKGKLSKSRSTPRE